VFQMTRQLPTCNSRFHEGWLGSAMLRAAKHT
jgi:hypothetical protein